MFWQTFMPSKTTGYEVKYNGMEYFSLSSRIVNPMSRFTILSYNFLCICIIRLYFQSFVFAWVSIIACTIWSHSNNIYPRVYKIWRKETDPHKRGEYALIMLKELNLERKKREIFKKLIRRCTRTKHIPNGDDILQAVGRDDSRLEQFLMWW